MKSFIPTLICLLLCGEVLYAQNRAPIPVTVMRLRVEYADNPIGLDVTVPRLSWEMSSSRRGEKQTAYHVRVASTERLLAEGKADVWDSGKTESDQSIQVDYKGPALESGRRYFWTVKVWNRDGNESPWSKPAYWETGLLRPADWTARWITFQAPGAGEDSSLVDVPRHFRKPFELRKPVRQARLYASALGVYQPHLNGQRIGRDELTPGWTDYRKRVQYQTYDVTDALAKGKNVIGALVGTGWYSGNIGLWGPHLYGKQPSLLMQLVVDYADGTREVIGTDESWKTAAGPVKYSDMLMGERYDARAEMPDWSRASFNDMMWKSAVSAPAYTGQLVAQYDNPVRVMLDVKPVKITEPARGTYIFDMGQNMVGRVRLTAQGAAGHAITLRFVEMLNPDGTVYTANLRSAKQTDVVILKGQGREVYEPTFTFHGFRYVEVTGYPGRPTLESLTGKVMYSDLPATGTFESDHAMLNQLQKNIVWGQRGNFLSIPTDCPQRDERLGWMGDAQIFIPTAAFNMDVARFFRKWMIDVEDAQRANGAFTDVAPDLDRRLGSGTAGWGDAGVIVPWVTYLRYGDRRILEDHYDAVGRWVDYLQKSSDNHIRPAQGYGDWLNVSDETPKDILATAYSAYSTHLAGRIARVLGKSEDAARYDALFNEIKASFNKAYVSPDGTIKGDNQTAYVLALSMDLLPENLREAAANRLVDRIKAKEWHLSTGFLGVGHLMPTLTESNKLDVAYRLLLTDTYPSWFYPIRHGATTIWERWDGWTEEKGFQDPGMNSFNHYSLGSVGDWLFRYMAGIETDENQPAFKHIIVKPHLGNGIQKAHAEYRSMHGPIGSAWMIDESGKATLAVRIPANTTATVMIPTKDVSSITESGKAITDAEGVAFVREEAGRALYEVGSGSYVFTFTSSF